MQVDVTVSSGEHVMQNAAYESLMIYSEGGGY